MRNYALVLFWGMATFLSGAASPNCDYYEVSYNYYSEKVRVSYDARMPLNFEGKVSEELVNRMYIHFERCDYQHSLETFQQKRQALGLNDWLYYDLIARGSEAMFPSSKRNFQILFQWFMLRKSGYDVQIYKVDEALHLHVKPVKPGFGFYLIRQGKDVFINLSARREQLKMNGIKPQPLEVEPGHATKSFRFDIHSLPDLSSAILAERWLEFSHNGKAYTFRINVNLDQVKMMDAYPFSRQSDYFELGLSKAAQRSLYPQLRSAMQGMAMREKVRFLMSFTRTSFLYEDDRTLYKQEKPMTAEQTLFYAYSDCEDRSALFYRLIRDILDLPVIVLDFQTHVGVAVALSEVKGEHFYYKGRKFYYCEPTGPQNALRIGQMWDLIREERCRVLTSFIPGTEAGRN